MLDLSLRAMQNFIGILVGSSIILATASPFPAYAAGSNCDAKVGPVATIELVRKLALPKIHEDNQFTAFEDRQNRIIWTLTKTANPAHPAAVCRQIVNRSGQIYVDMKVQCGAAKRVCDNLVFQFKQLNERMTREMQMRAQQRKREAN